MCVLEAVGLNRGFIGKVFLCVPVVNRTVLVEQ